MCRCERQAAAQLKEADVPDVVWHQPALPCAEPAHSLFLALSLSTSVQWSLGFISSSRKGKGKVFKVGDRRRVFLAQTPGLCSEESLLPESIGKEEVQSFLR